MMVYDNGITAKFQGIVFVQEQLFTGQGLDRFL